MIYEDSVNEKNLCNLTKLILNQNVIHIKDYLAHDLESAATESSRSMSLDEDWRAGAGQWDVLSERPRCLFRAPSVKNIRWVPSGASREQMEKDGARGWPNVKTEKRMRTAVSE